MSAYDILGLALTFSYMALVSPKTPVQHLLSGGERERSLHLYPESPVHAALRISLHLLRGPEAAGRPDILMQAVSDLDLGLSTLT